MIMLIMLILLLTIMIIVMLIMIILIVMMMMMMTMMMMMMIIVIIISSSGSILSGLGFLVGRFLVGRSGRATSSRLRQASCTVSFQNFKFVFAAQTLAI